MSLLTPEPLGFRHRNALKSYFLQSLLYFIEFEGLDDRLDFFHAIHPWPARNTRYFRGPLSIAGPRHLLAGSVPTSDKAKNTKMSNSLACSGGLVRGSIGVTLTKQCAS